MNLKSIRSSVQQAVQTTKQTVQKATAETAKAAKQQADSFALPRTSVRLQAGDQFVAFQMTPEEGIRVRNSTTSYDLVSRKGTGVSHHVGGREFGVHVRATEGAATLGVVDVEAAGRQVVLGMVPAAPTPLPMVVSAGADRDGEG